MTKEKAIECLNYQNETFFGGQSEALKIAISALSTEGDLISRQKVLNTLDFADKALTDEVRTVENFKAILTECIGVLSSAENKGEWLDNGFCGDCKCSVCKHEFDCDIANMRGFDFALPKFCPNCGAEMRVSEREKRNRKIIIDMLKDMI